MTAGPVKKRLVFYCHGYDPEADTRYRRLFVTAFSQLARRFQVKRTIGPVVRDAAIPADRWTIVAAGRDWQTETIYEILRWDDLVKRDFGRSWFARLPLLAAAMAEALRSAVMQRLFRVNWQFALFVIYPWAALLGFVAGGLLLGYGAACLIALAWPLGAADRGLVAVAVAVAVMRGLRPRIRRAHVYHLLDGWIFTWRQASGRDAEFDERLDRFSRHVVEAVRATDADEVLIVGHSTGSTIACELAARALALDPGFAATGPPVALLTIGSCLPIVGFVRTAERLRRDIARLVADATLLWVEYQAPQDVLNAFGFDPVRDLRLDIGDAVPVNPRIRSARFKETLLPASYRKIRWNFFRVHFHFLMANEVPGEYDYLMIACGPVSLADRIADPPAAVHKTYGTGPAAEPTVAADAAAA
jgi:pimeloyl-ACP methyl ester carboxylesterase